MGAVTLGIGIIVLAVGITLGIKTERGERRNFAYWLTVIGVGFTIAGVVQLA